MFIDLGMHLDGPTVKKSIFVSFRISKLTYIQQKEENETKAES